jgi:membrane-associated phospholipid phosphatase
MAVAMTTTTYDSLTQRFAVDAGARLRATAAAIAAGFRAHATLYGLAFLACAVGLVQSMWLEVPVSFSLVSIVTGSTFVFLFLIIGLWLAGELVRLWWTGHKGSPAVALRAKLLDDILAPGRVSNTLHAFTANGVFFVGFLTIKKNIPIAVPFAWDKSFMELDRALHFGTLPHELLAPLFQVPLVTFLVNVNYNLWFLVITAFFFWQGFRKNDTALRQKYLLSYLLTWLVGTCLLGTIFSSAGPCFYGFVETGIDPYAGLMGYLREANSVYPIWAVPTQDTLWQSHLNGFGDVEGVSAMPSMHVATTILFICCAIGSGKRWLVWFSIAFALSILIGSVLLGWHYAVDGYLGAAVAVACWKLSGWWVENTAKLNSRPS